MKTNFHLLLFKNNVLKMFLFETELEIKHTFWKRHELKKEYFIDQEI